MTTKVLFFDTSVLIKMFVDEKGTRTVKWLTSPSFKVSNSLHFNINQQVCDEFERKINFFSSQNIISAKKAHYVVRSFNKNYKNKFFRVIGQNIISNSKKETSLDEVLKTLGLEKGKNDWDGLLYQSIINALAYLGGESHPILVTCDKKFGNLVNIRGYRVINPLKQKIEEIESLLNQPFQGTA